MRSDPPSIQDRPRNKEHRLYIENYKQHGHDIKPNRISSARVAFWWNAALIGLELRANGCGGRPDKLCQDQCYGRKCYNQRRVNQNWNVCALHHSLTGSMLPLLSILGPLISRKAILQRGWWPSRPL